MLVLDEADEMLNKGFKEQIYDVYRYLPPATQVIKEIYQTYVMYMMFHFKKICDAWKLIFTVGSSYSEGFNDTPSKCHHVY